MPQVNLGGAPLVIPAGKAVATATGSVPLVTQAGIGITSATGGVPVVIPAGNAVAVAFGTPAVVTGSTPQTVTPTGLAVTTARGGVALAVPAGLSVNATLNQPPLAVPFGSGANCAFGAPNVSLSVVTDGTPTTTQLAGRGWAAGRYGWDDLLARWEQLKRDEVVVQAQRVEVHRELVEAPKAARGPLEDREEDIDERLDDLRWKMQLLQAEIAVREHERRAAEKALLDDDEEAIMMLL